MSSDCNNQNNQNRHFLDCAIDNLVTAEAARYIVEVGPDLSWAYLQYTDDMGHQFGDCPEQIAAVKLMDQQIGQIWYSVKALKLTNAQPHAVRF